jgi:hypothetical protein
MHVDHMPAPGPGRGGLSLATCPTCRLHVRVVGEALDAAGAATAAAAYHQTTRGEPPGG